MFIVWRRQIWKELADNKNKRCHVTMKFNEILQTIRHIYNVQYSVDVITTFCRRGRKLEFEFGDGVPVQIDHVVAYCCVERILDFLGPAVC